MDQTHLHLLISHLPIFGSLLGGLVLAFGISRISEPTIVAAYGVLILAALGAGVTYLTGEGAAETVEHLPGVLESRIESHEEFALIALIACLGLGVVAIGGLVLIGLRSAFARPAAVITLMLAIISFGLTGWTGYLGGQIRHTELNAPSGRTNTMAAPDADDDRK